MKEGFGMKPEATTNFKNDVPVDIADIEIDTSLPTEERIRSYINQIRDPYVFRCQGITVRIAFSDTDKTIEDRLEAYFRHRQHYNAEADTYSRKERCE